MVERQRAVDRGQHLGPVAQQVEGHHRRDEQQAQQVDDGDAALRHACRRRRPAAASACPAHCVASACSSCRLSGGRPSFSRTGSIIGCTRCAALTMYSGALRDQRLHLAEQRRQDRHRSADRDQHRDDGHHRRRPGARQARALQPRHDGVEEIGDHRADHEGQQDVVQQPQQQQEAGGDAEPRSASGWLGAVTAPASATCRHPCRAAGRPGPASSGAARRCRSSRDAARRDRIRACAPTPS